MVGNMKVVQVEEISKSRSKVYLEQETMFVLYRGELRSFHIQEGSEMTEQDYRTIMEEILPKRARLRSMNLLKSRDYTSEQLRQKLRQGYYPESIIEDAVSYVQSFHYVDDFRYAVDYITGHEKSRSHRRIEEDLLRKGISKEIIKSAWLEWEALGGEQDELAMIRQLLEKRHYQPEEADWKERQRTYAFLARKGYSGEQIRKVLNWSPEEW